MKIIKVLVVLLLVAFVVSEHCSAMKFSQPVRLNARVATNFEIKGFLVENATSNSGNIVGERKWNSSNGLVHKKYYDKGIARFGKGEDALYAHYDVSKDVKYVHWGSINISNTFPIWGTEEFYGEDVYRIDTNEGITLYFIVTGAEMPDDTTYYLLGRRKDGSWVKYLDTDIVSKEYFGTRIEKFANNYQKEIINTPAYDNLRVEGNVIIIEYSTLYGRASFRKAGEFRFKWDESTQWFGVEQIKY